MLLAESVGAFREAVRSMPGGEADPCVAALERCLDEGLRWPDR